MLCFHSLISQFPKARGLKDEAAPWQRVSWERRGAGAGPAPGPTSWSFTRCVTTSIAPNLSVPTSIHKGPALRLLRVMGITFLINSGWTSVAGVPALPTLTSCWREVHENAAS